MLFVFIKCMIVLAISALIYFNTPRIPKRYVSKVGVNVPILLLFSGANVFMGYIFTAYALFVGVCISIAYWGLSRYVLARTIRILKAIDEGTHLAPRDSVFYIKTISGSPFRLTEVFQDAFRTSVYARVAVYIFLMMILFK